MPKLFEFAKLMFLGHRRKMFKTLKMICIAKTKESGGSLRLDMLKLLKTYIQLSSEIQFASHEPMMNIDQVSKLDYSNLL
jgi:hypothetical protein